MTPLLLSFRAQLLFLAVGLLVPVYGQDQTGRRDVLTGINGQNACQLKDAIHSACSSTPSPALDVMPTPTLCTCNNVFFNIWSACSFASGNNTLPVFSLWSSTCTANNISLTGSAEMKDGGGDMLGITIPAWADIPVPGNTSFDLQQAVLLSQNTSTRRTWTIVQIVLPIFSALLAALLTVFLLKFRFNRRRPYTHTHKQSGSSHSKSRISIPSFPVISRILHPTRRVRNLDQRSLSGWVIDEPTVLAPPPSLDSGAGSSNMHPDHHPTAGMAVSPPSPPDTPHRDSTVPGHPSEYSDTPRQSVTAHERGSMRDLYPFSREEQERTQRMPLRSAPADFTSGQFVHPATNTTNSNSNTPGTSTPRTWASSIKDVRLPYPFKRRPVQIVSTEPTKRFRIDGSSEGSESVRESLAQAPHPMPGRTTGRVTPLNLDDVRFHFVAAGDADRATEVYVESTNEDEGTNLITDEERKESSRYSESNSRTTHGTSINSKIKIESPTASTVSPRSSMPGTAGLWPTSTKPTQALPTLPTLPPVPRLPAPLPPPAASRVPPRGPTAMESGPSGRSNATTQNNTRAMFPIPEDQQSIGRAGRPLPLQQQSAKELPTSGTNMPTASSLSRPVPIRSHSGDSEISVQSSRRPLPSPALSSSSSSHQHQRSNSGNNGRGPLPDTPPLYFNNMNNAHRRSGSNNSSSSIQRTISPPPRDLFDDPLFMPNRRGLSADDSSSFYLTADPPTLIQPRSGTPSQSQSQDSGSGSASASGSGTRLDPASFFPGAVRGAGYG